MVLPAGPSATIVVERLFLRGWQVEKGQRGMAVGTDVMVVVVVYGLVVVVVVVLVVVVVVIVGVMV